MYRSGRLKPPAEANVGVGDVEPPAIDTRARIIISPTVPVVITGGVTPADNFANPTDAITVWSLIGGLDAAGTWDRLRTRPWPTTNAAQTASAAALDTIGVMVGPDGAGNLVSAFVDASGNQRVAGAVTPADNFATPANAVATFSLNAAFDGATWDRNYCRAIANAVGQGANPTAAVETLSVIAGRSSTIASTIQTPFVDAGGQLFVTIMGAGSVYADNTNQTAIATQTAQAIALVRTQTTLPATYTDARWNAPSADAYAQLFAMDGRPANNGRSQPSGTFLTAGGGDNTIANAPCVLRWLDVVNLDTTTTIVYVQLHNVAAAVGAGAVPVLSFPIGPGGVGSTVTNLAARFTQAFAEVSGGGGLRFSTGLHIAISSTAATYTAVGTTVQVNASFYT
jgi:hypothetical protein